MTKLLRFCNRGNCQKFARESVCISKIIKFACSNLAKWLNVCLRTKWFWVRVQLQSLQLQVSRLLRARNSLIFSQLQSVDSLWNAYVTWQEHTVRTKEHSELILRIKGAFPMFFVISNRTVQNRQNLNKSMIERTKRTQSFPFIKQHFSATSLKINHKIPLPCFCH